MLNTLIEYSKLVAIVFVSLLLQSCDEHPWNDPYPYEAPQSNTLYSAFSEHPKHLDPARSYSAPEWQIICQIYEPPLQYHYLKRPYILEPLTAVELPEVQYLDKNGNILSNGSTEEVAYTDHIIRIKPGIFYQKHPAFAKYRNGSYVYHPLSLEEASHFKVLADFKERDTREVIAEDYVYQIKRLAEPHLSSPIFGFMSRYILGLNDLRKKLSTLLNKDKQSLEFDLRAYFLEGATVIDRYTYRIRIQGKYPQFHYWLATPFFSPIPWEAVQFYAQSGFEAHNISLDWYPIGTGPFWLSENNPERRLVLNKNSAFRKEWYPTLELDRNLKTKEYPDTRNRIPMIDKVIFSLEKESTPYWEKFLQGYYDSSGISSDNFGSSIQFTPAGSAQVTELLKKRDIRLQTSVAPEIWYWGFNLLDSTVGGHGEKARKLRQAIAMAFDIEEFISIFMNGRGIQAGGPIPLDIFGFDVQPRPVKPDIKKAHELLKEAGYAEGLTLYFDTVVTGDPDEIATGAWLQEQFAKIGIQIVIRGTDFNRFQEKIHAGDVQMFFAGWKADYPDPENFLFLLYGPNSSVKDNGENISNYANFAYDKLFEKMKTMEEGKEKLKIIQQMVGILQNDVPWIGGFYPSTYVLQHQWFQVGKPSEIINNTLKYIKIDPVLRIQKRLLWNKPILWPLGIVLILTLVFAFWCVVRFLKKERSHLERL